MTEVHEAVGSYVVDALNPAERAEFERHLSGCESCQIEAAELSEVAAELAGLTARPAPAALRTSILAAIDRVPQLSPDRVGHRYEHDTFAAPAAANRTTVLAGTDQSQPVVTHDVAPLEEHPSVIPDWSWSVPIDGPPDETAARRHRRTRRILSALVAAVAVIALALGAQVYALTERNQAQVAQTQLETELLAAPDATTYASTLNGATVRYVVSKQRNQALFLGSNLAGPGPDQIYQLWLLKDGVATSAGLVTKGGSVAQLFSGPLDDTDTLAVTQEPRPNGALTPTSEPLSKITL